MDYVHQLGAEEVCVSLLVFLGIERVGISEIPKKPCQLQVCVFLFDFLTVTNMGNNITERWQL